MKLAIELSDRPDNRDDTEKRYYFIQKSLNEVSLGKLLWCSSFVSFYLGPYEFVYYITLRLYCVSSQRVEPVARASSAQEWVW